VLFQVVSTVNYEIVTIINDISELEQLVQTHCKSLNDHKTIVVLNTCIACE